MRNLKELNMNEGGEPVNTPSPTPNQIANIENLVGTKLPPAYIEFLQFSNGGHPELGTFYFDYNGKAEEWGINSFFSISSDFNSIEDVVWNYTHRWPGAPHMRTLLPIAGDGVGNLIC